MEPEVTVYAFGDGLIGHSVPGEGVGVPMGALFLARGGRARVLAVVASLARRGHERGVLLVPGVPEAVDPDNAYKKFLEFFERVQTQLGPDSNFQSVRTGAGAPW